MLTRRASGLLQIVKYKVLTTCVATKKLLLNLIASLKIEAISDCAQGLHAELNRTYQSVCVCVYVCL